MPRMITVVPNNFLHTTFEVTRRIDIDYRMAYFGNLCSGARKGSSYSGRVKDGFIYLYTTQKFRKKTKIIPLTKKYTKKTGDNANKFKTEIIHRAHWKVRVYKFPLDRVVKANQENRTFKITISS